MNSRKSIPTTSDIHSQIIKSFEDAGKDIEPISVDSQNQALSEVSKIVDDFSSHTDWDYQVNLMNRIMGLVNGGLLQYETSIKELSKISISLISAAKNLRSSLVKQSCLLITHLVHELGPKFDAFGEFIVPLSSQTSHGTQIIAESCRCTIVHIARFCTTKRVLHSIIELSKFKASANREISAECIYFICGKWPSSLIEQQSNNIIDALIRLAEDAAQNTRKIARDASQLFIEKYPQYKNTLISDIDERSASIIINKKLTSDHTSFLPTTKKKKAKTHQSPRKHIKKSKEEPNQGYISISTNVDNPSTRSKSTLPSRPNSLTLKANLKLEVGRENDFLDTIEEYINTNQQYELSQSMNTIIFGLFTCATDILDNEVSNHAMEIIHELIHSFPKNFIYHLARLIEILLEKCEQSHIHEQILRDLQAIYDPNILLFNTEQIAITPQLLRFDAKLCDDVEADLKNHQICSNVYEVAMTMIKEKNCREYSKRIIFSICRQNREFLNQQENSDEDKKLLDEIIEEYQGNPDYPYFNPRAVSTWCDDVRKYIKISSFNNNKVGLFKEASKALSITNEKNLIIALMIDMIKVLIENSNTNQDDSENKPNSSEYEIVLPDLIIYYHDRSAKDICKLLQFLIQEINNAKLINSMIQMMNNERIQQYQKFFFNIRNIINIITEIFIKGNSDECAQAFENTIELLNSQIEHQDSEVRRAVINAYVELSLIYPDKTKPIIQNLTIVQQKLINFYQEQKK